jgi:hypothetical protein
VTINGIILQTSETPHVALQNIIIKEKKKKKKKRERKKGSI